jgi:hypothetical protein
MKKNDAQVCLKLAGPLRSSLEAQAAAESRGLSSLIRKILIEHSTRYTIERGAANAGASH